MQTIPLSDITIPEYRQRREFPEAALADLSTSIATIGLIHPIVLRDGNVLVAGERRYRALQLLAATDEPYYCGGQIIPAGHAAYNELHEMSELEIQQVELEENVCRLDLTWQEKAAAIANLHRMKQALNPTTTRSDTARVLVEKGMVETIGGASAMILQSTLIQNHMSDADVAKAKNPREAMKIISRKETAQRNKALAIDHGRTSISEQFQLYNENCIDWLVKAKTKQFDCILIDPPYGMGADQFGDAAGKLAGIDHQYDDSADHFKTLMQQVLPLLKKVGKDEHHLYIFCDIDNFHYLRDLCRATGYWTFRTPLINIKREGGRVPWPENGPRRCYEICLYAVAGKKPVTGIYRDIFESTLESGNIGHGAQKPIECYTDLLRRSTRPGDLVLDCFAGSGTIIPAAAELKLRAVAVEMEEQYFGLCLGRLAALQEEI